MSSRLIQLSAAAAVMMSLSGVTATTAYAVVPTSTSAIDADAKGVAMQGYDPVAYFTQGAPSQGNPQFKVMHDGAIYYFANAANMKRFKKNPLAYLPQFGGFCAMGTAMNRKFEGDPKVWHIVDNKLYLNVNADVDHHWSEEVPANIARANQNWPEIKSKTPAELEKQ